MINQMCVYVANNYNHYFSLLSLRAGSGRVSMCDSSRIMTDVCSAVLQENFTQSILQAKTAVITKESTNLSIPQDIPEK